MENRTGILLVNLGTPASPALKDVRRYLHEFLTDRRVIDMPWIKRQLLVRGLIVPSRARQSARSYQQIWTEEGSPLKVYGYRVKKLLQEALGEAFIVELAMRYQTPSISEGIQLLMDQNVQRIVILPLFPQYASATTGSVWEKTSEVLSAYETLPHVSFISHFGSNEKVIDAFCASTGLLSCSEYDHILFSFHGLPKSQILKADTQGVCFKSKECCALNKNSSCYSAQCYATALAIAKKLHLEASHYSISFQSRLGKDPWLQPYTSKMLEKLAKEGKKRILVFSPSFVCDCLETTYEIGIEYALEFKQMGGEVLDLVAGLNDHPKWIEALVSVIHSHLGKEEASFSPCHLPREEAVHV